MKLPVKSKWKQNISKQFVKISIKSIIFKLFVTIEYTTSCDYLSLRLLSK